MQADNSQSGDIILARMSKVKVKFNYGGEHTVLVNETRSGPIDWINTTAISSHPAQPEKKQITDAPPAKPTPSEKEPSIIDLVERAQPAQPKPALNTYKSAETLPSSSKVKRQESAIKKPVLEINDANQEEFNKTKPQEKETSIIPQKIERTKEETFIKAPIFRAPPKNGAKAGKKDYVKGENAERYLYSGLPEKEEDEFVGCFGCMRRKPRTYSVERPS